MLKIIIETDNIQEFDSLVEGYLTHKKRHEFKTAQENAKAKIERLENANANLKLDNKRLSQVLANANEEISLLKSREE